MTEHCSRILGLDLGTNSVGWAVIGLRGDKPAEIVDCGVRIFEAGLDGDIESGKAEPRNAARRTARQIRRQTERRRRRKRRVFNLLQRNGLLAPGDVEEVIPALDRRLTSEMLAKIQGAMERRKAAHLLPYWLRTQALSQRLSPHALGRALYHLAQRRGFMSNRKVDKASSETGVVLEGINDLADEISGSGSPTLGAYLATLDPEEVRIRGRWTARSMYEEEFEKIWAAQFPRFPNLLTEDFRSELHKAMFFQRPLKSVKDLVGACSFELKKRRAQWATLGAQDFRLLQRLIDTRLLDLETGEYRALTAGERRGLFERLQEVESLTFSQVKKCIGVKNSTLNWEEGGEKRFLGNKTSARLSRLMGARWAELSQEERDALVDDLLSIHRRDTMIRRAVSHWGLERGQAEELADLSLEPGYCNLSRKALKKINPKLSEGLPYATAVKEIYPECRTADEPVDHLPCVQEALPELRNPVVSRVLTEVRKVVNSIVTVYGRPSIVRVELARDLKSSRPEKLRAIERNRSNEKIRARARERILEEMGSLEPTRHDILKVQLAEECEWICPYTGRQISMASLVGPHAQFDVEHIIPFSRCFDNSFVNKTLCYAPENRARKFNRSPVEAYAGEPEKFEAILSRVRSLQGPVRIVKLRRFQARTEDEIEGFRSSQLNDTRYASTLAVGYVGRLFGGAIDGHHRRRVEATRGLVSALLRNAWNLNSILSRDGRKSREDHRHHAVDAIAIALTNPAIIKEISLASSRSVPGSRVNYSSLDDPWECFLDDAREAVENIRVSHRPSRKVSGALHEETLYSPPKPHSDGRLYIHRRKAVHDIGKSLAQIVDPVVRAAVERKVEEVGGDPKKLQGEDNLPTLTTGDGREVPIRRVRIRVPTVATGIGAGPSMRQVILGSNHHLEIFAEGEPGAEKRWVGRMVTLLEATDRLRKGIPVVGREHPEGYRFKFSLTQNDIIEIGSNDARFGFWRVQKMSQKSAGAIVVVMQRVNDARQVSKIGEGGRKWSPNTLMKDGAIKVSITPIGAVRRNSE